MPAELSEKGIAAWLNELPLANIDYSGQALLQLLRRLSQSTDLSCGESLALMELLRPTAYMLADRGVEMHLGGDVAFPLSRLARRGANLGLLLCQECARVYRGIVENQDFFSAWALGEEERGKAIYRAMEAYCESLHKTLVFYMPVLRGFWHDVYGLYRLAEQRGMHRERVMAGTGDRAGDTIERRFKHILLFALANCQRHRPLEIRQIHAVTGHFAHLADLEESAIRGSEQALFVLSLNTDSPPRPVFTGISREGQQTRYLFTRTLTKQALTYYSDPGNRRWSGIRLRRTMLKRMLHALGAPERRKSNRVALRSERVLTVGLDSLTRLPAGGPGEPRRAPRLKRPGEPRREPDSGGMTVQVKGVTLLNIPDYQLQEIDESSSRKDYFARYELAVARHLREGAGQVQPDEIWVDRGEATSKPGTEPGAPRAWTINFSARGYCLSWVSSDLSCLRVDELIGVPAEDGGLNIGVIRWLSHDSNENLLLGVELLSPLATPVSIAVNDSFEEERRGLLLPVNKGLRKSSSLLTPPACFQVGEVIRLEVDGHGRDCRLEKLLETNFSFSHFEVVELGREAS
jgi:hypothetical protein